MIRIKNKDIENRVGATYCLLKSSKHIYGYRLIRIDDI